MLEEHLKGKGEKDMGEMTQAMMLMLLMQQNKKSEAEEEQGDAGGRVQAHPQAEGQGRQGPGPADHGVLEGGAERAWCGGWRLLAGLPDDGERPLGEDAGPEAVPLAPLARPGLFLQGTEHQAEAYTWCSC